MTNGILFSVIIPTYNRAHLIKRTIDSVLQQEYPHFEIIVVDDGSTDNTGEIVKSIHDERIKYIKQKNSERGAARNTGIKNAIGNYIGFLDSDDIYYPNHLYSAKDAIRKTNADFIIHSYNIISGKKMMTFKNPNRSNLAHALLKMGNFIHTSSVVIKKDFLINNLFQEDRELSVSEDYELWLRLSARTNIYLNNIITSALIQHPMRSELSANEKMLRKRTDKLIYYLSMDSVFMNKYGNYINNIRAYMYSYSSLHLSISGFVFPSLHYLFIAFVTHPVEIFNKRSLIIIKNCIISMILFLIGFKKSNN